MKHLGTQTLETPRLLLRRFEVKDAQAMFENWTSDPEVTRYLTWPPHENVEVTQGLLQNWVHQYDGADYYSWAIVSKEHGSQPIGSIAVVAHDDSVAKATVGYCLGRNWWHRGYMTEALTAVIRYLLEEVGMNRVEAYHDPRNPHSGCVMKKCGMTYEGTLRQSDRNNQGICDASWHAILADLK